MIGKTISHYRINRQIGAGGMGVVYEAVDTKLDRTVALKFLPPEATGDPQAKARFIHEAKAASALDHPNVCTVYEIDETEDGQIFLAMACYQGETLKARIAKGPLPIDEAMDITRQVADGLAEAHERKIVHRDIKPANLFVTSGDLVKILDFGLAKLSGQTKITRTGTTLGTASYMSPEQARGEETDHRSDLWCLGVVLYEMVTGRVPFPGENGQAVIHGIVSVEPPPPTGLRTGVPLELERIIGKCLAKDPQERYQHAGDLLADLRHLERMEASSESDDPTRTMTASHPPARPRKPAWPRWLAAAVLVVMAALVAWKMLPDGSSPDDPEPALAIIDFQDLVTPDNLITSSSLMGLLNTGLIENCPVRVISEDYLHDLKRRRFGEDTGPIKPDQALQIAREAGATLLLAGRISRVGEEQFVTWRLVDTRSGESVDAHKAEGPKLTVLVDRIVADVLPVIAAACGVEQTTAPVAVDRITTDSAQAYDRFVAGVRFKDRNMGEKARDELESAIALDPAFALAHLELGRVYWGGQAQLRDADKSNTHLGLADSLRTRLGSKDRLRLQASIYDNQRRIARSIATYEEILNLWPDDRQALLGLMDLLFRYWDLKGASSIARQGLELYPDDLHQFGSIQISMLVALGRPQDARRLAKEYVERFPQEPNAWDDLGLTWLALGKPDSADAAYRRVYELDPSFGTGSRSPACAYSAGDLDGAIALTEQYLERDDLAASTRSWRMLVGTVEMGLGSYYREGGRYREALEVIEQARQYSHGNLSGWAHVKGGFLIATGRAREALEIAGDLHDNYVDARAPFYSLRIRALASVNLGDLDTARAAVEELYAAQEEFGAQARAYALKTEAEIALAENSPTTALEALDKLLDKGVPFSGLFAIEILDARARAHRMAGRLDEAAAVHRELLRIRGGHALSHYELGLIYEEMDRPLDAKREFTRFLEMWWKADEGLPQLVDARQRLAALQ